MRHCVYAMKLAATAIVTSMVGLAATGASADEAPPGRAIGYVLVSKEWAVYAKEEKVDCPEGLNDGPREQFKALYPADGTKRKVIDTYLERESAVWHPSTTPEPFTYKESVGGVIDGLNLDGRNGLNDFTHPLTGETGIDNQLFRVLGCIKSYRPQGRKQEAFNRWMVRFDYSRVVLELTNVDSLINDDDVDVSLYRGLDRILQSADGQSFAPGGTQHIDARYGGPFTAHTKGQIKNGILLTDPVDVRQPESSPQATAVYDYMRGARLQLNVMRERAEGHMAGYTDIDTIYFGLNKIWSTGFNAGGDEPSPTVFRALRRHADGYPDPITGVNTAISSAIRVKFVQVYVQHPAPEPKKVANSRY